MSPLLGSSSDLPYCLNIMSHYSGYGVSLVTQMVKNLPSNVGDKVATPGLRRSLGEGSGNPLRTLACRIPWTEEPSGLKSLGSQELDIS